MTHSSELNSHLGAVAQAMDLEEEVRILRLKLETARKTLVLIRGVFAAVAEFVPEDSAARDMAPQIDKILEVTHHEA